MPGIPGKHFVRNLVAGRTLLFQLVKRDFARRFVGSAGGWVWGLIHTLVMLALMDPSMGRGLTVMVVLAEAVEVVTQVPLEMILQEMVLIPGIRDVVV